MREHWSSKLSFVLATLGGALGLGAMWKLPFIMGQNGGGAFILLFIIFNFVIGLPLFIGELILGRQSQKGVVLAYTFFSHKNSLWSFLGWLTVVVVLLILGWYCVVGGWGILYILLSLCDSFNNLNKQEVAQSFDAFRNSGSLNILFQVCYILLNISILLKGINQGIEKWSKFMTSALFLVLIGLSIYAAQLDGFNQAFNYILIPNFKALSAHGALQALALALFTLSLGYGANITYGSYLKKNQDIPKTASIVVLANLIASILIAITIFPMIFTFGFLPESGEGLIFKTLPFVFGQLKGSMILSVIFFSLLLFAALTSSLAMFEVVIANFIDLKIFNRKKAVLITAVAVFALGFPTAVLGNMKILDTFIDWLLVAIALFTAIFVAYFINKNNLLEGFENKIFFGPWLFLIKIIVPLAIIIIIVHRTQLIGF